MTNEDEKREMEVAMAILRPVFLSRIAKRESLAIVGEDGVESWHFSGHFDENDSASRDDRWTRYHHESHSQSDRYSTTDAITAVEKALGFVAMLR